MHIAQYNMYARIGKTKRKQEVGYAREPRFKHFLLYYLIWAANIFHINYLA